MWTYWRCGRRWGKKKAWASKVGLVMLLAIDWKEPNHDALVEF